MSPNGVNRAGLDAEQRQEPVGFAEGEAARGADAAMKMLEVDLGIFLGDHEKTAVLTVDEKEIFRVAAGQLFIQPPRFSNREERVVAHRLGRNA